MKKNVATKTQRHKDENKQKVLLRVLVPLWQSSPACPG
jgi:hypothetical protein